MAPTSGPYDQFAGGPPPPPPPGPYSASPYAYRPPAAPGSVPWTGPTPAGWAPPPGPVPPGWGAPQPVGGGKERPVLGIVAGILLVMVLLGAGLVAAVFGGTKDDDTRPVFEPVGEPISGANPGYGSNGSVDPNERDVLATALPPGAEVAAIIDRSEQPDLADDRTGEPGPTTALCTQISPNSLGSHTHAWVVDRPEDGWEADLSIFDYGTPAEAARTITARQTDDFADCIEQSGTGAVNFPPGTYAVKVIDTSKSTTAGKAATSVLMEGNLMTCRDDGRIAIGYRQVEQYSISAKVFGCGEINLSTLNVLLDLIQRRITG